MAIVFTDPEDSNLSQESLRDNWNAPPVDNNFLITNDYIAKSNNFINLFENDRELQRQINELIDEIADIKDRLDTVEALAANNALRLDALEPRVDQNEADIANNAAQIATNITNIAQNASDIADINDGRYSPQFGTGSPENVVTSNRNQSYLDTATNQLYLNDTTGVNTGWRLIQP